MFTVLEEKVKKKKSSSLCKTHC